MYIAAPRPVDRPQANSAQCSSGASRETFASAISGITAYSAKTLVPMKWRIGSPARLRARRAVRQMAEVLLGADRHAEVGARRPAVLALAALGREQRDDVIADRDVGDALADRLDHARALMAEHGRRVAGRVGAGRRVHVRVADAGGDEPHEHLARARILQVDFLDDERGSELLQYGGAHLGHVREPIAMWVLFDLNGTLVDPAVLIDPPELPIAALDEANMMAMITVIAGARGRVQAAARGRARARARAGGTRPGLAREALDRLPEMPAYPDVPDALQQLRDGGCRLAVLTQSGSSAAETVLANAGIRDHFEHVLSAPESGAFKPEDLAYHGALEKLGATEAWFVAGHWWDVAGAAYAGLKTAWVSRTDLAYPLAMPAPDVQGADIQEIAKAILAKVGT